ncbi:MAG: 3-deoxy-7-phosphoheptulonate synthase, partial [Myxococcales bacterium]|nr:3-deoxy-7-phosphoheptulonate synthase [Myxococcales bacterium]
MRTIHNVHVLDTLPLPTPKALKSDLPLPESGADLVYRTREEVRAILRGRDRRAMVIVGPCSIHDPRAALEYAERLLALRRRL